MSDIVFAQSQPVLSESTVLGTVMAMGNAIVLSHIFKPQDSSLPPLLSQLQVSFDSRPSQDAWLSFQEPQGGLLF